MSELKATVNNSTIVLEGFNTLLSIMAIKIRQMVNKNIGDLNTIKQLGPIYIYKTHHHHQQNAHYSQVHTP